MEKKLIYMDNAATTPVKPEVLDAMLPYFTEKFGNPSSIYSISSENKKAITDAREVIAKTINTTPENIYFTAGGSESDNWALKATADAYASKGKHIITTKSTMRFFTPVSIWRRKASRSLIWMWMRTVW